MTLDDLKNKDIHFEISGDTGGNVFKLFWNMVVNTPGHCIGPNNEPYDTSGDGNYVPLCVYNGKEDRNKIIAACGQSGDGLGKLFSNLEPFMDWRFEDGTIKSFAIHMNGDMAFGWILFGCSGGQPTRHCPHCHTQTNNIFKTNNFPQNLINKMNDTFDTFDSRKFTNGP